MEYSEPDVYSEFWDIQSPGILERFAKIVNILYERNIMNFFIRCVIFTPTVLIIVKEVWRPRGLGTINFDILRNS